MGVSGVLLYLSGLALLLLLLQLSCFGIRWVVKKCSRRKKYSKVSLLNFHDYEANIPSTLPEVDKEFPVLPPELWISIFELLTQPQDTINCINAFPTWNYILADKKISLLFASGLPHVAKYLTENDIKTCRLVCSLWKSGTDHMLQTLSCRSGSYSSYYYPDHETWLTPTKILNLDDFEKYLQALDMDVEEIQPQAKNPFLSKSLIIRVSPTDIEVDDDTLNLYCSQVSMLISAFGLHVNRLVYNVKAREDLHNFPTLLRNLPNLQYLEIIIDFNTGLDYAIGVQTNLQGPLPPLPHLKSVIVTSFSESLLAPMILQALLRDYKDQLETLECTALHLSKTGSEMPHPLELTLQYPSEAFLKPISFVSWPLQKLDMLFKRNVPDDSKISFTTLFRFVKLFSDSLTYLKLHLTSWKKEWIYLEERKGPNSESVLNATFPKMKTLWLSDDLMEVALVHDLVKCFPVLEHLYIDMGYGDDYFRGRKIFDTENKIWGLCHRLKVIERVRAAFVSPPPTPDLFIECKSKCSRELVEFRQRARNGDKDKVLTKVVNAARIVEFFDC